MRTLTTLVLVCFTIALFSQTTILEGYIYETGNRGYISNVSVTAENMDTEEIVSKTWSDEEGYFKVDVPINSKIRIYAAKEMFDIKRVETEVGTGKTFLKLEMGREPGYTFEVTLAEKRSSPDQVVDAITGARIEVFNNTTRKSVMDLKDHDIPEFQLNLQKGNHYTILIRKNGFLSKRMEAKVDVEGCILCFEGVGTVDPGVSDNLTEGNSFGVLLANVELERIFEGKTMEIQNLYYDLAKWSLKGSAREELNKVITLMKDNPSLTLELGSHTDSRGSSESNLELSKKRAKSAVKYLLRKGDIAENRVISKGYGEKILLNECANGVKCSEEDHAKNRRTELKIIGITDVRAVKSLAQMKEEEFLEAELMGLMNQEQIQAKDEEELKRIIEADKKVEADVQRQIDSDVQIQELDAEKVELMEFEDGEERAEKIEDEKSESSKVLKARLENKAMEEVKETSEIKMAAPSENPSVTDGVKVVLYQSKTPLPQDHWLFKRHTNVEMIEDSGKIFYMIGGFDNESDAFKYRSAYIFPDKKYQGSFIATITDGVFAVVNQ